jgi:phosphatidylinositol-3-phosphatase
MPYSLAAAVLAVLTACGSPTPVPTTSATAATPATSAPSSAPAPAITSTSPTGSSTTLAGPVRPDHVLIVVFENKAATQITAAHAPYLTQLMATSAMFPNSRAVAHPSQPNYLALFSGSTQGVTDDHCPLTLHAKPNLARQLIDAGHSFTGYSEAMPSPGFTGCTWAGYAAKHNPWVHFDNVPASVNQPGSAFPTDFTRLPSVAFLVPDLCNDMHDCSVSTGDGWARSHLDGYLRWATQHNSLLVVTFDEDDNKSDNQIFTLVAGAGVKPGRYSQAITHYTVLATIEDLYGLPRLGHAAGIAPIKNIWLGQ